MPSLTSMTPAAALVLALLSVGPVLAQSSGAPNNTLSIEQRGTGNTLTVDQSAATGSKVGGLEISGQSPETFTQITRSPITVTTTDPLTGKTQQEQKVETQTQSVTLDVLRSNELQNRPALQSGIGNVADVTIGGTGGFVGLLQNSAGATGGNTAIVNLGGSGTALVGQIGGGNTATVDVSPGAISGSVLQQGSGNIADLDVVGSGARGSISQIGNGLNSGLNVVGANTDAALVANGVTSAAAGAAVTVISNGASVTITQSPM